MFKSESSTSFQRSARLLSRRFLARTL
jgi:hypothetical protein